MKRALLLVLLAVVPGLSAWEGGLAAAANALRVQKAQCLAARGEALLTALPRLFTRGKTHEQQWAQALPQSKLRASQPGQTEIGLPAAAPLCPLGMALPRLWDFSLTQPSGPLPLSVQSRGPPNWLRWQRLLL